MFILRFFGLVLAIVTALLIVEVIKPIVVAAGVLTAVGLVVGNVSSPSPLVYPADVVAPGAAAVAEGLRLHKPVQ